MNMEINTHLFGDSTVDVDTTIHSGKTKKKSRVVGLLGLVLTTRIMLSMLRTIGLNDSDIVMWILFLITFSSVALPCPFFSRSLCTIVTKGEYAFSFVSSPSILPFQRP